MNITEDREKSSAIKEAFETFKGKMRVIKKKQLSLFDKIDRIVSKDKAEKIRNKINNS